jgi:cytochrome c oxidase subunit 2
LSPHSGEAQSLKRLFIIFLAVAAVVWVGVTIALLVALWRRQRDRHHPLSMDEAFEQRAGRTILLLGLATIVTVLALSVASYGTQSAIFGRTGAELTVRVIGHQWWWQVQYPADGPHLEFETANEIRVPAGQSVSVELETADVIHSFWVPSLMGKMDLINNQQNRIQFTARNTGIYRGQCAEFCGLQHAHMALTVVAVSSEDFEQWRAAQIASAATPQDAATRKGAQLFVSRGCALCHAVRGTPAGGRMGPDLTHLASRSTIAAGALPMSAANLAAWISDPQHIKPGNFMPRMRIDADEMIAITKYLESLQ